MHKMIKSLAKKSLFKDLRSKGWLTGENNIKKHVRSNVCLGFYSVLSICKEVAVLSELTDFSPHLRGLLVLFCFIYFACHNKCNTQVDLCDPTVSHIQSLNTLSSHTIFLPFSSEQSVSAESCKLLFPPEEEYKGDPISLHLLIPKSKLVSMRNRQECVSLTFFVECICTSCSSNLKQPTASLIESSPWRLLSGAQVSSKKQHVHMNATNDHMLEGVDPQPVLCDPLARKKGYKSFWQDYGTENDMNVCHDISSLEVISYSLL